MNEANVKQITTGAVQPQKYNILLTRDGDEIDFNFQPATAELITRFGFLIPADERCESTVVHDEEAMYKALAPVLGSTYNGSLAYHTRKQTIISLHDTAVLGYQRQVIIDPRISNEIGTFWEVFLDQRIFPQAEDVDWQALISSIIIDEQADPEADRKLAEDIKNRLLEQAQDETSD